MKTIDVSNKSGVVEIILDKEGMEVVVVGTFEVFDKDVRKLHVKIIHKVPHTRATTTLKGVAWDAGQLKLSGTIVIEHEASQTSSFLTEKILLLSPKAHAEAIPNLEIHTDDVKCSHAATVSKIPEEHVFYLMSRGIPHNQVEKLIVEGFLKM